MTSKTNAADIDRELHFVFNERSCHRAMRRYKRWTAGHSDRLDGKPCASTDGDYLDGWYSPEAVIPDFVTHTQAAIIRHRLQFGEWPKVREVVTEKYILEKR